MQKQVNELIEILLSYQGLSATKQILYWQGLIDHPHCAHPRALLTDQQRSDLRRRLATTAIAETLVR